MEDKTINDSQITASSYLSDYRNDFKPHLARLNNQGLNYWAPDDSNFSNSWIQVEFLAKVELYGIKTQGFVTVLKVQTGDSEESLTFIEDEGGNPKVKV